MEQSVTFLTELTIHMIEKTLKEDRSLHYFAAIAARTDTQNADALKDQNEKASNDQKNNQTMFMDDNYHQHHQFTTIHEAEHHIDLNHEMGTTIILLVKTTEINKITGTLTKLTMIEVVAIIETIIIEV